MLQNATPLRKLAPGPPNISDEHVSCTAPATRHASLQIFFKCPTSAIVFENATKPSFFAHFWQGAESLALVTQNDASTSKSGTNMWCFVHFDFDMCFAPQCTTACTFSTSQVVQTGQFFTLWLENVLLATTACTFSTSQLPKVVRTWGALCILAWKCASRHNGLHFFDIPTSKSAPRLKCLVHFDFEKCSRHNGVLFFISHLASWLCTRRFSEPAFRPSGATNQWKNTVFRDFPTFSPT